jgi:hypothetical protein
MIRTVTFAALVLGITGCMATDSRYDEQAVRNLPDSYFTENLTHLSRVEYNEFMRRKHEASAERDRQAACVFGSRPAIDRKKLNCENVKGSPEYKALNGR